MHRRRYSSYISTLRKLRDEPIDYTRLVPTAVYQGNNKNLIGDTNINITLPDGFVAQNGPAPHRPEIADLDATIEQIDRETYDDMSRRMGVIDEALLDREDVLGDLDERIVALENRPDFAEEANLELRDQNDELISSLARFEDMADGTFSLSSQDSILSGARPNTPTDMTYLQGISNERIHPSDYFDTR